MKTKITPYIRAGYAGLYLISPEEQRVEAELKALADPFGLALYCWSAMDGLVNTKTGGQNPSALEPLEALQAVEELPEKSLVLLRDFHLFLLDPNPLLIRKMKDVLARAKTQHKTLLILGCRLALPPELEREFTVLDFALPDAAELDKVLAGILESAQLDSLSPEQRESVLNAAKGLTTMEAENAFALSVVESRRLCPEIVAREKAAAVKKNGLLEVIETTESLDSLGGLVLLKAWLLQRRHAFSQEAITYGLPSPKGLLICGLSGTGKSLTAKATAKVFGLPLLKLEAGRIFAGLVGQSEANLRSVIQTAEAVAPCCLWIDELDKSFAGAKSSGSTDGGTSARVFGSFISWMQEKTAPVFVVTTANDVSQLPPELLRKGRWDELFFVDLPTAEERRHIWSIQIQKLRRDPKAFDLPQLARMTEGFTGSEIEQVFVEALYLGFAQGKEPTDLDIAQVVSATVPLSKLMAEPIQALRSWSQGRARPATSQPSERKLRKMVA